LAFPLLFPGGIGDIKKSKEYDIDIAYGAQNLLFYEDGRFSKDNLWCFFVLNYIQRHRNKSQSRWSGTSRTPGWKIKNKDEIEKDTQGFNKISLRRNHNKLLQTSSYCL